MAANSTTERTVKTKFDGDSAGMRRAAREAERELERLRKTSEQEQARFLAGLSSGGDKLTSLLTTLTGGVLKVGAAAGSAQGLAGAAAAAGALSGSLLVLPGLALTGAAAVGVLKLATAGFSEAVAAEDAKAWTEATKDMAPPAVRAAQAVRDQNKRFTELRRTVQGRFFAGFDSDVRSLADRYFPILKTQTGDIAGEMNAMGRATAKALFAPESVDAVNKILGSTKNTLHELEPAAGNVLSAILQLGGEGAQKTTSLGRAITKGTADFKAWVAAGVESGEINRIMDRGIDTAKDFGKVLVNLGQIGGKLFGGLQADGESFVDELVDTTQAVEDFLDSAEGQDAIRELGETLRVTADVARDVLAAALREAGPLITEAAPAVRAFATAVGEFLVDAIQVVGPLLQGMARFVSDNQESVSELVPVLLSLAIAYKGLKVATEVKGWMSGLPAMFDDTAKKANAAGDAVGDKTSGKGIVGKLGQLQGIGAAGFTLGSLLTIDAATQQGLSDALNTVAQFPRAAERAKAGIGEDFWSQLFEAPAAKPGDRNDIRNWVGDTNFWQFERDKRARSRDSGIKLNVEANTLNAELDVNRLLNAVNSSSGTVNINGNPNSAGFALRRVLQEIAAGKETVTIDGQAVPAQEALRKIIDQINIGTGTVTLNGSTVPAGQALADLLNRIGLSSSSVRVGADTSGAQGVVDSFIRRNDGRTVQIYTSVLGSGGIASAGRLATGGRPYFDGRVEGPGTSTSDTAGFFRLSTGEHVWSAREVKAAGGHAAMYRARAAALAGRVRGFARGGTPRYLTATIPAPRPAAPNISLAAPNTTVTVLVDGRELRALVRTEIDAATRSTRRAALAGTGRGW